MSLGGTARARSAWLREHLTHDRILQIHSQTLEVTFALQNIRHDFAESILYGSYSLGLASAMAYGHLFVHGRWRNAMIGAGVVGALVGAAFMVNARKLWVNFLRHPRKILSTAWLPKNRQVTLNLFRFLSDADDKYIDWCVQYSSPHPAFITNQGKGTLVRSKRQRNRGSGSPPVITSSQYILLLVPTSRRNSHP